MVQERASSKSHRPSELGSLLPLPCLLLPLLRNWSLLVVIFRSSENVHHESAPVDKLKDATISISELIVDGEAPPAATQPILVGKVHALPLHPMRLQHQLLILRRQVLLAKPILQTHPKPTRGMRAQQRLNKRRILNLLPNLLRSINSSHPHLVLQILRRQPMPGLQLLPLPSLHRRLTIRHSRLRSNPRRSPRYSLILLRRHCLPLHRFLLPLPLMQTLRQRLQPHLLHPLLILLHSVLPQLLVRHRHLLLQLPHLPIHLHLHLNLHLILHIHHHLQSPNQNSITLNSITLNSLFATKIPATECHKVIKTRSPMCESHGGNPASKPGEEGDGCTVQTA
ncbi:hypothetical protein M758_10G165800 [Ceratodon purpureus]|nr:hypothetical protein M758_10G165800 [Ceratodon purpureus]